ncbi:hypothetical protein SCUCBS95973_000452 [Sporothrix curviconia]|uniref:Uncharacterized protein n=1 Tax=Sporothrix curviconia TaxID=1260050 RepID=A0ABP0AQC1_9PEZI
MARKWRTLCSVAEQAEDEEEDVVAEEAEEAEEVESDNDLKLMQEVYSGTDSHSSEPDTCLGS